MKVLSLLVTDSSGRCGFSLCPAPESWTLSVYSQPTLLGEHPEESGEVCSEGGPQSPWLGPIYIPSGGSSDNNTVLQMIARPRLPWICSSLRTFPEHSREGKT